MQRVPTDRKGNKITCAKNSGENLRFKNICASYLFIFITYDVMFFSFLAQPG